jgi:hypothetical protein
VACRTPLLLGRARSSETGFVLLSMTVATSGNSQPIAAGIPGFAVQDFYKNS